jgi:hypothetical protein
MTTTQSHQRKWEADHAAVRSRSASSWPPGTAVRRLADEHKLPDTTPKPTFTLGLDS